MKFTQSFRKFAAIPSPNLQLNYVSDIAGHAIALMKGYLDNTKVSVRINPDNLIIQSDKSQMQEYLGKRFFLFVHNREVNAFLWHFSSNDAKINTIQDVFQELY